MAPDPADVLFDGPGDMRARCRAFDWAATPLDAVANWPAALRTAVGIVMASPQPMWIGWGPMLIQIYNDAYVPLTDRSPGSLGRPASETWADIWPLVGADLVRVRDGGPAVHDENRLIPYRRGGSVQDVYFSFSFSAIPEAAAPHGVGGVLIVAVETTTRVELTQALLLRATHQLFLLDLNDALRRIADPIEIQVAAHGLLGRHLALDRCGYAEIDPSAEFMTIHRDYCSPGTLSIAGRHRLEDFGQTVTDVVRSGQTLTIDDVASDPRVDDPALRTSYAAVQIAARVVVPLIKADRLAAVLFMHQSRPRSWLASDIALVEEVADRTWAAVERARSERALRISEEKYRGLFDSIDQGFCIIEMIFDDERPVDYRFLEVNARFVDQTGLEGAVGRTVRELVPQHDAHWFEMYGRIAITGQPERFTNEARALGRWYDVYAFRVGEPHERTVAVVFNDVTRRQLDEEALRGAVELMVAERAAERDTLRRQLVQAEEAERRRLVRDLHDEAGQHLAALSLGLKQLTINASPESDVGRRADELRGLANTLAEELHSLAVRLRPKVLDDFGLEAALSALVEEWSRRAGIAVDFHAKAGRVRDDIETAVYRIAQEALTNVGKHSRATRVSVVVEHRDGELRLIVEDDGSGFDVSATAARSRADSRLGLAGMQERAALLGGRVRIESSLGDGTSVFAELPTAASPADNQEGRSRS